MDKLLDFSSGNWSYHSIPAAFAMIMIPHFYGNVAAGKKYDLATPRRVEEILAKDASFDKVKLQRIQRAKAAVSNGFETIALYASGVVAANVAGVAPEKLNKLAFGYVVSRFLYNHIYVFLQDNRKWAPARTVAWMVGLYIIMNLWISAGNAANAALSA